MGFRVPAPDGKKDIDGLATMVLPEDTILKGTYKVNYLTAGGMSIIYYSERSGKKFILKEVSASDTRNVMSLAQEKSVLERLNHPGIVDVFDLFEEDGFCYLVVEYVDGVTLDRKIPIGSDIYLNESLVQDWAFQLMDIFEYLHSQTPPVIYRDLKPRNIMLNKNGKIKLIDFGIARTFKDGKHQDTEHMGSMITASPEHYGGAQTDKRSDIYTIGATLHFILTNGKATGGDAFEFPPVRMFNKKISANFEAVIEKALKVNPDQRFQSVAEMRAMLKGKSSKKAQPKIEIVDEIPESVNELEMESKPTNKMELKKEKKPEEKPKLKLEFKKLEPEESKPEPKPEPPSNPKLELILPPKKKAKRVEREKKENSDYNLTPIPKLLKQDRANRRPPTHIDLDVKNSIKSVVIGLIIGVLLAGCLVGYLVWDSKPKLIDWRNALANEGKVRTVEGEIREVYETDKNNIYLYFVEQDRSNTFRIGIFTENFENFHAKTNSKKCFENEYLGTTVRVTGKIDVTDVGGYKLPQIFARKPSDIQILQRRPGT